VHGTIEKFQEDPFWKDYPLFYEYFHGDTGRGVGASHQTGWTGTVAVLMHLFETVKDKQALAQSKAELVSTAPKKRGKK
jgi:hypothetical protein